MSQLESRPYLLVSVAAEWIQIEAQRGRKQKRILWYDGQFLSQIV